MKRASFYNEDIAYIVCRELGGTIEKTVDVRGIPVYRIWYGEESNHEEEANE